MHKAFIGDVKNGTIIKLGSMGLITGIARAVVIRSDDQCESLIRDNWTSVAPFRITANLEGWPTSEIFTAASIYYRKMGHYPKTTFRGNQLET